VCHLIDANIDTAYFRSIAQNCNRERYPVAIGSLASEGTLQHAMRTLDVPTFALGAHRRLGYGAAILGLRRILREQRASMLHAHCFDPTLLGLLTAHLTGIPFVFTRHHSDHNIRLGKRWHTGIDGWCGRRADHVIAVSEATKQIMCGVERVPAEQITVVYNGLTPLAAPPDAEVRALRDELRLGAGPVLLVPARLHEEKGHRHLFAALPQALARYPDLVVLLAGDGGERPVLEAEVRALGLGESVRFLGRRPDVPALLAASAVVVVPSLAESFGLACAEAMSMGRPVIGTTVGGVPEVVADGITGLLIPPADSSALARALCRLLESPELRESLGRAGRERVKLFSPERMMRGYEDVYRRVLAAPSAS
jgi:glycosyltransferase involved in cell wall biosynthesis